MQSHYAIQSSISGVHIVSTLMNYQYLSQSMKKYGYAQAHTTMPKFLTPPHIQLDQINKLFAGNITDNQEQSC